MYSRFTFTENTIGNLPKVTRAKFPESNLLFSFISIYKFGSFKNPFAMITSLSELYFRIIRFILLVQKEKMVSVNYGSSTRSWKPWRWMRLDLIFSMRDIYINSNPNLLAKFTGIHQHKNSHKLCDEIDSSFWISWKVNGNWDNNIFRNFQWRQSHCRTNTSVKKEISPKEQNYENHSAGFA